MQGSNEPKTKENQGSAKIKNSIAIIKIIKYCVEAIKAYQLFIFDTKGIVLSFFCWLVGCPSFALYDCLNLFQFLRFDVIAKIKKN